MGKSKCQENFQAHLNCTYTNTLNKVLSHIFNVDDIEAHLWIKKLVLIAETKTQEGVLHFTSCKHLIQKMDFHTTQKCF